MDETNAQPSARLTLRMAGRPIADPPLPAGLAGRRRATGPEAVDPFLPPGYVRAVTAIDRSPNSRSTADGQFTRDVPSNAGQVVAIELPDGVVVYTSPERLAETVQQMAPDAITDGTVDLDRLEARERQTTRDVSGVVSGIFRRVTTLDVGVSPDAIIADAQQKLAEWLGDTVADRVGDLGVSWLGTKALLWAIESRLDRAPGLYRWTARDGEPSELLEAGSDQLAKEAQLGPLLVFIHGTASNTVGSYGDLQSVSRDYWRGLETFYGSRIFAFEHRTMSESPIENALQLARALPAGARLHLVTHSRGGLVGDLLTLDALGTTDAALIEGYRAANDVHGAAADDRDRMRRELHAAYSEHQARLRELGAVLREKRITVERYVRVAAPARGTRLASGNLDVFLSSLLTLVGLVPALAGNPIYSAFKRVVLEIVKNRTRPALVPGIEAMLPESPMARLLARATPNAATQMAIIAGDIEGGGLLKRLGVLFTDHVFFNGGDNDLVVDTDSMYMGVARPGRARALFAQGSDVSHFNYFRNPDTRDALSQWLRSGDVMQLSEFAPIDAEVTLASDGRERWEVRRAARGGEIDRRPVVVVLPGIMGSHLWVDRRDRVWIDLPDLATGGFDKIAFSQPNIDAERIYDGAYGDLCEYLADTHRVVAHPYDWRQPLDVLADRLASTLRHLMDETSTPVRPIRLLAHSMGGLVVRALVHKHPALWKDLMSRSGARLVFCGTPNRGSFAMVETLIGKNDAVRKLALVDLRNDMQQLLNIIGDFRGALQLLPREDLVDAGGNGWSYFSEEPWQRFATEMQDGWFGRGAVARPSDNARRAGRWLWDRDKSAGSGLSAFTEQIAYVHGAAPTTPSGVRKVGTTWKMVGTSKGDGTVTWESGVVDGVVHRYYMPAAHGALLDSPNYFASLLTLLSDGDPGLLLTSPPVSRGDVPDEVVYDAGPPVYPSEEELAVGLIGHRPRGRARTATAPTLRVRVRASDLRDCTKTLLVGHYESDPIAGAEALVDSMVVDGALSARYALGLYAGALGTATVVITPNTNSESSRGEYRGAVVAGLGRYDGSLGVATLTEAVRNGALRYLLHIHDTRGSTPTDATRDAVPLASLLLGYNSSANLSINDSMTALLRGVVEANKRFRATFPSSRLAIDELEIVELYIDTAITAGYALRSVATTLNADAALGYRIEAAQEIQTTESMRHRLQDARTAAYWPRLIITDADRREEAPIEIVGTGERRDAVGAATTAAPQPRIAERLRFLYLGQRARAESVVQQRQPGMVERLMARQLHRDEYSEDFSRTLFQVLVPADFKDAARQFDKVILVLDSYTANLPWELMLADDVPLAARTSLVRQLSSSRYRMGVRQTTDRRAYVIGNPSVAGFAAAFPPEDKTDAPTKDPPSLTAAEEEAWAVHGQLSSHDYKVTTAIGLDVDAYAVVNALYRHPYRVLHIAAHGVFESKHLDGGRRTGVVLSDGLLITAAEIGAMEVVPDLVFLNCCHIGQVSTSLPNYSRLAASLSRELIDMGVRAVVAAGWAVDDDAAALFAETFYGALLDDNAQFGDAVFTARKRVYQRFPQSITWGAYQAYGDPGWRIEPRGDRAASASTTSGSASRGEARKPVLPSAGTPAPRWQPVAPEEVVALLEQKRVQLRRNKGVLPPSDTQALVNEVEAVLRDMPQHWRKRLDVEGALGALFADLGPAYFERATSHYTRVVKGADKAGRASMTAIEQLANLEARIGERANATAPITAAIRRLEDLSNLSMRDADVTKELVEPGSLSAERRALRGSAWKRLAVVHARSVLASMEPTDTHRREMARALSESLTWYGGAIDDVTRETTGELDLYTAVNRLFLIALSRTTPESRRSALTFAGVCANRAVQQVQLDASYWDSATKADIELAEVLLRDDADPPVTPDAVERVAARYDQARTGVLIGPKSFDSTVQQLVFMATICRAQSTDPAETRRERLMADAAMLARIVRRLDPLREIPDVPSLAPTQPEGPSRPAARKKRSRD
jgi:CHAT domain-containing protein